MMKQKLHKFNLKDRQKTSLLFQNIVDDLKNPYWSKKAAKFSSNNSYGIHLAIFVEPYLQYILDGKKTIESRFSINRFPPYHRVFTGDVLLLKKSGGPIIGICEVTDVWSYELDKNSWAEIRKDFTIALHVQDPEFWARRQHASFATLMKLKKPMKTSPIFLDKRDRRGWVVLKQSSNQTSLENSF